MKQLFFVIALTMFALFLSSCEVEYIGDVRYHHFWGYEHRYYPEHLERYNRGYHHEMEGGRVIERPNPKGGRTNEHSEEHKR